MRRVFAVETDGTTHEILADTTEGAVYVLGVALDALWYELRAAVRRSILGT